MPKKSEEPKKEVRHEIPHEVHQAHHHSINESIAQNLVELQKVHLNLLERIDKLTNQMTHLLNIFETAAKNFGESPINQNSEKDKEFLSKIDSLLEQNKTIAKGLTLMEEHVREKLPAQQEEAEQERMPINPRPLPKF